MGCYASHPQYEDPDLDFNDSSYLNSGNFLFNRSKNQNSINLREPDQYNPSNSILNSNKINAILNYFKLYKNSNYSNFKINDSTQPFNNNGLNNSTKSSSSSHSKHTSDSYRNNRNQYTSQYPTQQNYNDQVYNNSYKSVKHKGSNKNSSKHSNKISHLIPRYPSFNNPHPHFKGVFLNQKLMIKDTFKSKFTGEWMSKWRKAEIVSVKDEVIELVRVNNNGQKESNSGKFNLESENSSQVSNNSNNIPSTSSVLIHNYLVNNTTGYISESVRNYLKINNSLNACNDLSLDKVFCNNREYLLIGVHLEIHYIGWSEGFNTVLNLYSLDDLKKISPVGSLTTEECELGIELNEDLLESSWIMLRSNYIVEIVEGIPITSSIKSASENNLVSANQNLTQNQIFESISAFNKQELFTILNMIESIETDFQLNINKKKPKVSTTQLLNRNNIHHHLLIKQHQYHPPHHQYEDSLLNTYEDYGEDSDDLSDKNNLSKRKDKLMMNDDDDECDSEDNEDILDDNQNNEDDKYVKKKKNKNFNYNQSLIDELILLNKEFIIPFDDQDNEYQSKLIQRLAIPIRTYSLPYFVGEIVS